MAAEIVIEDLAVGQVLLGVSWQVNPGERFAVHGAGDPLAELLAGLRRPDRGMVHVDGGIALAAAEPALFDRLTCREQLAAFAALHRRNPPPELLAAVGLAAFVDHREDRLSPERRRRLGLACALVAEPAALVLDAGPGELWPVLATLPQTVLFTTDDPAEAARADRVALLGHGRLLTVDRPADLMAALDAERRLLDPTATPATLADVLRHLGGREAIP
ncbi:ATP-binding cassette domain-containing protein [Crossiella sp. NPDC003009]